MLFSLNISLYLCLNIAVSMIYQLKAQIKKSVIFIWLRSINRLFDNLKIVCGKLKRITLNNNYLNVALEIDGKHFVWLLSYSEKIRSIKNMFILLITFDRFLTSQVNYFESFSCSKIHFTSHSNLFNFEDLHVPYDDTRPNKSPVIALYDDNHDEFLFLFY